jgi:D-alanine-D-alanine ligase
MRIAVVHNSVPAAGAPDEQDVLAQADAVTDALRQLGHKPVRLAGGLNLSRIQSELRAVGPQMVFNLVESLDGTGRLIHLFPFLLDAMALPYTGAGAEALMLTSNKLLAKSLMESAGLPTPAWVASRAARGLGFFRRPRENPGRWIVKSVWEHASVGLDAEAVLETASTHLLHTLLEERAPRLGGACFAEAFIDGREFNLSLLESPDGLQILPPAEIIFEGFEAGQARIVDYQAKWDPDSYAYHHTPRRFDIDAADEGLMEDLRSLSRECWDLFGLRGYARVDFRVDHHGRPWILEINANPCLSPDAGFAAAVHRAGLSMTEAVGRIVEAGQLTPKLHKKDGA